MKAKVVLLLFVASLFSCCLLAQQQKMFYYYKGDSILLNVNTQHFLVYADANKVSKELFEKEYRVTEWIEDGGNGILEAQINIPNGNYDSVISILKEKVYIVDIEPVIGDDVMVNTSRLFYVKLYDAQDYPLLNSIASRTGVEIRREVPFCENWYELRVNKNSIGNSIDLANMFWESQNFADIDPEFILHFEPASVTTCVSDPRFDEQWGMQAIKACSAWKITKGDTNVRIAVIDMGIDTSHREFDSTHVVYSYDIDSRQSPSWISCEEPDLTLIRDSGNPNDPDPDPPICFFHGIHVGGIIFANHNRDSVAGVCPNAGLIDISHSFKLYDDTAISRFAQVINMSVSYGARVINNSWECPKTQNNQTYTTLLENAIDTALAHDCVMVFAAGNHASGDDVDSSVSYPANCRPNLLVVGAIDSIFKRQQCSSYGPGLDIVAPGSHILSTHENNGYYFGSGTSMAAPHVSGVAGLMFSINPGLKGQDIRDIIEQTVRKDLYETYIFDSIKANGLWDTEVGYGLLDAHRAVLKAAYHKVYGDTALAFCDTSRHPYTVRAPHNANIDSVSFFWTCSDNLQMVAGQNRDSVWVKFTNSGIGQLQCHIIHDGDTVTSTLDISNMSGRTMYDNLTLNSSLSYPDTFVLSREVVVDSLTMLTWQDKTVLCTPDCRLIVRPRGLLTLNHTTLTSACPNEMWQGIEVVGDRTKQQTHLNQGVLHVGNGSVIENAFTAVRNCLATDGNYVTSGGIIAAEDANFVNNCRAVEINPYSYSGASGVVFDYVSSFQSCTFTVNDRNLFAANDTVFSEHVKLWDVKGLQFKGCHFTDSMSVHTAGSRGIYAEDAGLTLDTYCDGNYVGGCVCPENHADSCSFSGFTTAVEVNTTGNQYPVVINQVRFSNNGTGVVINGNNFATVTRCDFDMQETPTPSSNRCGLYLNNSTGYLVEENIFYKKSEPSPSESRVTQGVTVTNSGYRNNLLHRNGFARMSYGVYASGNNYALQLTCNSFQDNLCGIYSSSGTSLAAVQGSSAEGADNTFEDNISSDFYNAGITTITYFYSAGGLHAPTVYHGLTLQLTKNANSCTSTLCDGGGTPRSLAEFQSDMDADTGTTQPLSDTYYTAVRTLMADTVLNLNELEQWHTAAQPIADPYSLTETRFMEGYAEIFAGNAEDAETANYAEFHAMKLSLRDNVAVQPCGLINWYALTPAQIAQLQTIAERNIGRASVMAKGVLCFFYGICYEDEWDNAGVFDTSLPDGDTTDTRAKRTAMDTDNDATLSVYPNPTDDVLFIELSGGAGIANVALYDLQGRVVRMPQSNSLKSGGTTTVNVNNIPAGVYILRVTDANGKAYHQKIVRK